MAIDLEKLLNYLQRKTADTHELQAAKTILELIERLEAAEKQRDELNRLCEFNERTMTELLKQRDELLDVVKYFIDEVWMTDSQYELCRQAIAS